MIDRLLFAHPRSVGESYAEHFVTAFRFGATMLAGWGAACLVHAAVPVPLFTRTASERVKRLYGEMKARQPAFADRRPAFDEPEWQLEYEILDAAPDEPGQDPPRRHRRRRAFPGTLQVVNLLRHDGPRATLIERSGRPRRGARLGGKAGHHPSHVLNVRAANMSAFPG